MSPGQPWLVGALAITLGASAAPAAQLAGAEAAPLHIEKRIDLGPVRGRIDHLAIDLQRQRVFVAELGNDSVAAVDVGNGRLVRRLTDVREPQGVAYLPQFDRLYVASGDDGTVRAYAGEMLTPAGAVDLGDDADNLRAGAGGSLLYSGHGDGAITALDPATLEVRNSVKLPGHPESFLLESRSGRAYVNVPDAAAIVVFDRMSRRVLAKWPTGRRRANFPMALDEGARRVYVAFRQPAWLQTYDADSGAEGAGLQTCGDADDVFLDRQRRRLYVVCGEGFIDVVAVEGSVLARLGRFATAPGARTGLYSSDVDRLFVPVRETQSGAVALWVIRPVD